jgi:hypothetical protein
MAYSGNKPSTMGKTSDKYRSDDKASTVRTGDRKKLSASSGSYTSEPDIGKRSDTKAARRGTSSVTSVSQWFVTICCLGIPVIGAIYAICIALNSRGDRSKRHFAAAYIIFKILVWILVVVILYVIYKMGLNVLEIALDMMSGE